MDLQENFVNDVIINVILTVFVKFYHLTRSNTSSVLKDASEIAANGIVSEDSHAAMVHSLGGVISDLIMVKRSEKTIFGFHFDHS